MMRTITAALIAAVLTVCVMLSSCGLIDGIRSEFKDTGDRPIGKEQDPWEEDGTITVTNVSAGTILDYFSDVAIGSEYGDSADVVCKWTVPVKYFVEGDATKEDRELISRLCGRLNEIDGFPGISEVSSAASANMTISFIGRDEIIQTFPEANENCSGMALFEWDSISGKILSARCAVDSETTSERACTICEEFLQSLGPARDSNMIPNSVFYQGFTLTPFPTDMDFAVMELLYSPKMPVGASRSEAMSVAATLVKWGE